MRDGTYHAAVWMPPELRSVRGCYPPVYTRHARDAAADDGVRLPELLDLSGCQVVEVTVEGGKAVKLVVRLQYDAHRDLVLVLLANGVCKTCWVNYRDDQHSTLKRHNYVQAPGGAEGRAG